MSVAAKLMKYPRSSTWQAHRVVRICLAVAAMALLLSWNITAKVQASAAGLDSTFGDDGKVTTSFPGPSVCYAIAVQPDGKIVAAGIVFTPDSNRDFAVARYNTDGSLDSTFGSGGRVTTDFFGNKDGAVAVAFQSDGKIVVAGHAFDAPGNLILLALARYNSNGSLDTSFGSGGKVTGGRSMAESMLVQPDNKILVGGHIIGVGLANNEEFELVRFNPGGTLDESFGSGGEVTSDFSDRQDNILALALQPDGRILAAGVADRFAVTADFALARYKPNGKIDKSFGTGGKLTTNFNLDNEAAFAVAVQPDGKIIAVGRTHMVGGSFDFAIARYNSDGTLDSTFDSGGKVTTDFSEGYDQADGVALQPNGKIIVSGWTQNGMSGRFDFGLARYNLNGGLDLSFGVGGKVTTDFFGEDDTPVAMSMQFDGKILVAGSAIVEGVSRFALARYVTSKPRISSATVSGKQLLVAGEGFDGGAVVLINGKEQSTVNDDQNPMAALVVKKGGKKIKAGETAILQVRNSDGALSQAFNFTRSAL